MSTVSLIHVQDDDVELAVRTAVEKAGAGDLLTPGCSVLLKPNLVKPMPSGSGVVTDARIIEAVVKIVLEHNVGKVIIGEGSSVGYDFPGQVDSLTAMEANGTADIARTYDLPMIDLNHDERVWVEVENAFVMPKFGIAKTALDVDITIDLPVIKTHARTGITCALKNMKGVLPGVEKKRTHRMGLERAIVDLNRAMLPQIVIVDALIGLAGTHDQPEDKIPLNRVLCSTDAVAADTVAGALLGFNVDEIHHVALAGEAGLGETDLAKINIVGDDLKSASRRVIRYAEAARKRWGDATIIEENSCTGCWGEMESAFLYINKAGYGDRLKDLTLVLGMPKELPDIPGTPVIIGKCARDHKAKGVYIPGCPPHGIQIAYGIAKALGLDKADVEKTIERLHNGTIAGR